MNLPLYGRGRRRWEVVLRIAVIVGVPLAAILAVVGVACLLSLVGCGQMVGGGNREPGTELKPVLGPDTSAPIEFQGPGDAEPAPPKDKWPVARPRLTSEFSSADVPPSADPTPGACTTPSAPGTFTLSLTGVYPVGGPPRADALSPARGLNLSGGRSVLPPFPPRAVAPVQYPARGLMKTVRGGVDMTRMVANGWMRYARGVTGVRSACMDEPSHAGWNRIQSNHQLPGHIALAGASPAHGPFLNLMGGCGPVSDLPNRDGRANSSADGRTVKPERSGIVSRPSLLLWRGQVLQESQGDPKAYKADEDAAGIVQIRPCVIEDLKRLGLGRWTLADRFDPAKSREIWLAYLTHYGARFKAAVGRKPTDKVYARIWNGGPDGWRRASTLKYWRDVKANMDRDG